MVRADDSQDTAHGGRSASYWIESLIYNSMRQEATEALCHLGKAAVPALLNAAKDPNNRIREEAVVVLKKIDPEAAGRAGVQ